MKPAIRDLSEAEMEARMLREVTEGIDGTTIRAGIIKIATNDAELSEWDQKIFRCAARVNKATGIPIGTHAVRGARNQFDFLVKHGANPRQTFFSHVEAGFGWQGKSREQMAESFLSIAQDGGRLLFNNFGRLPYPVGRPRLFDPLSLRPRPGHRRIYLHRRPLVLEERQSCRRLVRRISASQEPPLLLYDNGRRARSLQSWLQQTGDRHFLDRQSAHLFF